MDNAGRKALDDMAHDVLMKLLENADPDSLGNHGAAKYLAWLSYDIAKAMKAEGDRHVA